MFTFGSSEVLIHGSVRRKDRLQNWNSFFESFKEPEQFFQDTNDRIFMEGDLLGREK